MANDDADHLLRKIEWRLPEQHHFVCGVLERRVKSRRRQSVGSRVGNLGLQCPRPGTPGLGTLREHQAARARCECEPAVSCVGSSSYVGGKTQESALTAPEKWQKNDGVNLSEAALGRWVGNVLVW